MVTVANNKQLTHPPAHERTCIPDLAPECNNAMADPQSDDSSAASSGDEILNLLPFSQEYSSNSPLKSGGMDSEDEIGGEGMHLSQDSSGQPEKKRKHEESSAENSMDATEMEEKGSSLGTKFITIFTAHF